MSVVDDISGFVDAQNELRASMGSPAVFHVPTEPAWPVGTKLNPTTGLPYDSTVVPTNARFTDITLTVLAILKQGSPLRPQPDTRWEQVGLMSGMDIILDVAGGDYPSIADATEFDYAAISYKVEERKPFELGGTIYRYLIYGMER